MNSAVERNTKTADMARTSGVSRDTSETLTALAARCAGAPGPDRDLDLRIAVAINYGDVFDGPYSWRWNFGGDEIEGWQEERRKPSAYLDPAQFVPRFTRSIDAASSLAPDALATVRLGWCKGAGFAEIEAAKTGTVCAATPALALCAASLLARGSAA